MENLEFHMTFFGGKESLDCYSGTSTGPTPHIVSMH